MGVAMKEACAELPLSDNPVSAADTISISELKCLLYIGEAIKADNYNSI